MAEPDTETKTHTSTPEKTETEQTPMSDPERHYNPERLCPDQSKDGGWRARP